MAETDQQSRWLWRLAVGVMCLLVAGGVAVTLTLALHHHPLAETTGVAVNVALLVVACLALVVARSQAVAARAANKLTQDAQQQAAKKEQEAAAQAIADSQRATRPYLWADLAHSTTGQPCWDLVIRNTGRTTAHDVHIDADPWPEPGDSLADDLRTHLTRPFDLPPNSSLRILWRIADGTDRPTNPPQPDGMPADCTLTMTYRGDDPTLDQFTDTRRLDAPTRAQIMPGPQEGARASGGDSEARTLKNIDYALRALNGHVAELRH